MSLHNHRDLTLKTVPLDHARGVYPMIEKRAASPLS